MGVLACCLGRRFLFSEEKLPEVAPQPLWSYGFGCSSKCGSVSAPVWRPSLSAFSLWIAERQTDLMGPFPQSNFCVNLAKKKVGGIRIAGQRCAHMIKQVTGDILLSNAQAIAHGIAPNDHFNSGLALTLRQDWPALYKDFRHYLHTAHPKVGDLWVWTRADGRRVINLFTQEPAPSEHAHPGKASYHNLNLSLRELHRFVETEKIFSLALPRLATGVGGLEWDQVEPLIQQHLGSLKIPIYVYTTYHKGLKAVEEGK